MHNILPRRDILIVGGGGYSGDSGKASVGHNHK